MTDLASFAAGLVATALCAAALAVLFIRRLNRRAMMVAEVVGRYRAGDLTPPRIDYGEDALGRVARAMDGSIQELGARVVELTRDRGRMAAILAGMIEGVIVVDPQGRVQLVNDAARQMLRIDDLAAGRPYVETIRHPAVTDLLGAALGGQPSESVQLSPPRDATRTITARAAPTVSGGKYGAVLVLHDITDLRRADQIRRDFVANVSHELRTPLTAIRGYVEALAEDDVGPDERRRFVGITLRHTLGMERLVTDLLRLARLDARQEALELVTFDTHAFLQSVVADLAPLFDRRDQRVDISVDPDAAAVQADPAKLHDALCNLVTNASAYAPAHTVVRIDARAVDGDIEITVTDEGPGIPEEDLPRIFERFYRVDKSRASDPGGSGLGLAIVKHLIELHGGRVAVRNRPGGGAAFTITFANNPPDGESAGSLRSG